MQRDPILGAAMLMPVSVPDDETLRRFRLGALPPDEVERVQQWMDADPVRAEQRLGAIDARDTVVNAIDPIDTSAQQGQPVLNTTSMPAEIGGYRILDELGRGGMGVVVRAENKLTLQPVAIKLIAPHYATDAGVRERFLREAKAVAKIDHPNVVPILHVGEDSGLLYIVMPLLKGETLAARLERGPQPSPDELMRLACDMAAGLAAAHAEGLVHRDIKPANVWLDADTGRARVLDFGLVKPLSGASDGLTETGAVMGTAFYMSPEQAEGKPVDARTDLFSLGSTLYHAATGALPFTGDSKVAVLISVKTDTPLPPQKLNPKLPAPLGQLIPALLAKDRTARPESASEVLSRLSGPAEPAPATSRRRKLPVRRRALAGALLFAAVLLVVVIVVVIRDKDGKEVGRLTLPDGWKVEIGPGPVPPVPVTDPDRRAAEWVLSVGGTVRVNGDTRSISKSADLPGAPFRLTTVDLQGTKATDEGMAALAGCKHLTAVYLYNTQLSDAGLPNLLDSLELTDLDVRLTKVSAGKIDELKELWPGSRLLWDNGNFAARPIDPDRRAAAWVLALGGIVQVNNYQPPEGIARFADLPKGSFRLSTAYLLNNKRLTDAHLALFKDCKHLTHVDLRNTGVTDAGLTHFKANKTIRLLCLSDTKVTDAGLSHFKDSTAMQYLYLDNTNVSDTGLASFNNCQGMEQLSLTGTKVTDAGVAVFKGRPNLKALRIGHTRATAAMLGTFKNGRITEGADFSMLGVTDADLIHLKDYPALLELWLVGNPKVTDAGVADLKACQKLTLLDLTKTGITEKGAKELAQALPRCKIFWNGGTIEPKK